MKYSAEPQNLIYGLIDPRTRLIRYVGLSSTGLSRPKQHRKRSRSDNTYCRRWVKSLQRLGLDYEITILEVLTDRSELAETECWWIAYGRGCGWPLTNLTDGGPSAEALAEMRRREVARTTAEAERLRSFYPPEHVEAVLQRLGVPAEIEKRCLAFLDERGSRIRSYKEAISSLSAAVCVTRMTAAQVYEKWRRLNQMPDDREDLDDREEFRNCCFQLFEQGHVAETVAVKLGADRGVVLRLKLQWWRAVDERKRHAAAEEKRAAEEAHEIISRRCFQLFEEGKQIEEVAAEIGQALATVTSIHKQWIQVSYERGKRALAKHREDMHRRLYEEKQRRWDKASGSGCPDACISGAAVSG